MELVDAIRGRRSIRKFKSDHIPQEMIYEILETARWVPSWGNTQPWEFYVLTGKPLEDFRKENHRLFIKNRSSSNNIPIPEVRPEHLKKRYLETREILITTLNGKKKGKKSYYTLYEEMTRLFGAPCLIVACVSKDALLDIVMLDIGLILQALCLLAYDKGIETCIMAMTACNPELLHKMISIPEDRKIIAGVALGYSDRDFPLNNVERKRADINEYVRWVF